MIEIMTSANIVFIANWCGISSISGDLVIEKEDKRTLPQIAEELEGAEWMESKNPKQKYEGPFTIRLISREKDGAVQIMLRKEG